MAVLKQVIAELRGCGPALREEGKLVEICERGAESVNATVVESAVVQYVPHGLTIALFLAESHVLLSTWPEYDLAILDILLCNEDMNPNDIVAIAKKGLAAARVETHTVSVDISP